MGPDGDRTPPGQNVRYVWDDQKLSWVAVTETPTEEAQIEPATEVNSEPVPVEAISGESALVEGVAVEAEAEAVALEYKGALIRLAAALIDFVLLTIVGWILRIIIGRVGGVQHMPEYVVLSYGLIYFGGFWWWRGKTPGKMVIGAKVVRTDGSPVGMERAFLRFLFYLVPIYGPIVFFTSLVSAWFTFALPIVGLLSIFFSRQRRGIHDLIAGTCVVNTRARATQPEEFETEVETEAEAAIPVEADESGPGTSDQG
jgi:uncharacterized RDD family membrane protein YckC